MKFETLVCAQVFGEFSTATRRQRATTLKTEEEKKPRTRYFNFDDHNFRKTPQKRRRQGSLIRFSIARRGDAKRMQSIEGQTTPDRDVRTSSIRDECCNNLGDQESETAQGEWLWYSQMKCTFPPTTHSLRTARDMMLSALAGCGMGRGPQLLLKCGKRALTQFKVDLMRPMQGCFLWRNVFLPADLEHSSKKCVNKREKNLRFGWHRDDCAVFDVTQVALAGHRAGDMTRTTGGKAQRSPAVVSSCEVFTPARSVTEYCCLAQGGDEMVQGR